MDNTCSLSGCDVSSTPSLSDDFVVGSTLVQYTVEDGAGNRGQCGFNVIVEQDCEYIKLVD